MNKFKKLTLVGVLAFLAIGFNGCISAIEEITFNRDGSGTYALNYDLSAMMSMLKDMGDMGGEEEADDGEAEAEREPVKQDTTMYFKDMMDADMKASLTADQMKFWEGVKMEVKMDEDEGEAKIKISFDFDKASQITYFQQNMSTLTGDDEEGPAGMGGMGSMISQMGSTPEGASIDFKGRKFSRVVPKASMEDLMDDLNEDEGDEAAQAMQMMKMVFSSATYKVVYHFPRKIKNTNVEGAMISGDGKTLIKEYSFLDIMEGNESLTGKVKLKWF